MARFLTMQYFLFLGFESDKKLFDNREQCEIKGLWKINQYLI